MSNNDYNLYNEQVEYIAKKYAQNIASFSRHHGFDLGVGYAMLVTNARICIAGKHKNGVIPGGGVVDMNELIADVKKLDSLVRK